MPGNARKDIVREGEIGTYHVWSRCVQRAFLCGVDPETGRDFEYRREWIEKLLMYLARIFAIDVGNYSILSNHKHAILRTRPDLVTTWSDEEVAWRWKCAWPRWEGNDWSCQPDDREIEELLLQPKKVAWIRGNLSSLSWFMARWKEPIARLANAEMDTKGHYWEARFGSRELEGDTPTLTCSLYIDLNQSKAGLADSFETSHYSAIQRRIDAWSAGQVRESLDHFAEQARPDQQLNEDIMRALLRDCFLSPIQADGPLMTSTTPADGQAKDEHVETPQPATEAVSPDPSRDSRRPPRRVSCRDQVRSTKVHDRLKACLRLRASDNLFLAMSMEQYLRLAHWALAKWKAEAMGELADTSASAPFPPAFADRITDPDNWYQAVDQFQGWFFRCVASDTGMKERAKAAGLKWLHGNRRCREFFP